ncbi:hypothetical protein NPX13_g3396 [Xylaria arbuscula]|uniref:Uncharacterized protein n=1 Tax=Xylaria arbuscula TaxID=114810 RepID=A0A9W8NIL1_9PEZI|nr:hypothetical protein NPX13_g3396 [Xylaria arbuscula]
MTNARGGVRLFDPRLDGEPEPGSAQRERDLQPIKALLTNFEKQYDEYESSFRSIVDDIFNPLHINDFDFLALALLDSPNIRKMATHAPASHANTLNAVLDQNGVPHSTRDNTSNTIDFMRLRLQSRDSSPSLGIRRPMSFQGHSTFAKIDRLVTMALKSPHGRRKLCELGDQLYESLVACQEMDPTLVLTLLNNVMIGLERDGLNMSTKLCDLGVWTSLKCNAIITAQVYIERKLENEAHSDEFIHGILTKIKDISMASSSLASHQIQLDVSSRLRAIYSLLTGYTPGEDKPTFSLRPLLNPKTTQELYLYVQCLARLGAFRTIWHEFHRKDSASHGTGLAILTDTRIKENSVFAGAIMHALAENPAIASLARSLDFGVATGETRQDCQLDIIAISRSADTLILPSTRVQESTLSPTYTVNREIVHEILKDKSIEKALPALQEFLMSKTSFS